MARATTGSDATRGTNDRRETDNDTDITERVLMSLAVDLTLLDESVERIRIQVFALMKQHKVDPVK